VHEEVGSKASSVHDVGDVQHHEEPPEIVAKEKEAWAETRI